MIDIIQLHLEELKREKSEIHFEFQEQSFFEPKPSALYVYGIIDNSKRVENINGRTTLATEISI